MGVVQNGVRTSGENPAPNFKLFKHLQIQHKRGTQILPYVKNCLQKIRIMIHNPRSVTNKTKIEKTYRERENLQEERTTKQHRIGEQDWVRFLFNKKDKTLAEKS